MRLYPLDHLSCGGTQLLDPQALEVDHTGGREDPAARVGQKSGIARAKLSRAARPAPLLTAFQRPLRRRGTSAS